MPRPKGEAVVDAERGAGEATAWGDFGNEMCWSESWAEDAVRSEEEAVVDDLVAVVEEESWGVLERDVLLLTAAAEGVVAAYGSFDTLEGEKGEALRPDAA